MTLQQLLQVGYLRNIITDVMFGAQLPYVMYGGQLPEYMPRLKASIAAFSNHPTLGPIAKSTVREISNLEKAYMGSPSPTIKTVKKVFDVAIEEFSAAITANKEIWKMKDEALAKALTLFVSEDLLKHPNIGPKTIASLKEKLVDTQNLEEISMLVRFLSRQQQPAIAAAQQAVAVEAQCAISPQEMKELKESLLGRFINAFHLGDHIKVKEFKRFFKSTPEISFDFSNITRIMRMRHSSALAGVLRFFCEEGRPIVSKSKLGESAWVLGMKTESLAFYIFWGLKIPEHIQKELSERHPKISDYCQIYKQVSETSNNAFQSAFNNALGEVNMPRPLVGIIQEYDCSDHLFYDACCKELHTLRNESDKDYFPELQPWEATFPFFWQKFARSTKVSLSDYNNMSRDQRIEYIGTLLETDFYRNLDDRSLSYLMHGMLDPRFLNHPNAGEHSLRVMEGCLESFSDNLDNSQIVTLVNSRLFKNWEPSKAFHFSLRRLKKKMKEFFTEEAYAEAIQQKPFVRIQQEPQ